MNIPPPKRIELNVTELCNRRCGFCPRAFDYPNSNLNLSPNILSLFIEQVKGLNPNAEISITGRGEPMLHPDIVFILNVLYDADLDVHLTTNGDNLHKFDDDIFKRIKIIINSYDSIEQMNQRKERWPQHTHKYKSWDNFKIDNRGGAIVGDATPNKPCHILYYKMFVDWNGTINLCCNDWSYKHVFGSMYETTLSDIWFNRLDYVRKQLTKGNRNCTDACSMCNASSRKGREIFNAI